MAPATIRPAIDATLPGVDETESRALLLLAAQGKGDVEEHFDAPSAQNGFSGKRAYTFEDMKEWRISSENLRHRDESARKFAGSETRGRTPYRRAPEVRVGSRQNDYRNLGHVEVNHLLSWRMAADRREKRWDISPDDRRPIRPKAIKSPLYSRSCSEERNIWDNTSGKWKKPERGRSIDSFRQ
ncbi:unnamed protein product [Sphacelaria rigidula]